MLKSASYKSKLKSAPVALRPENSGAVDAFKSSVKSLTDYDPSVTAAITAHKAEADPHPGYLTAAEGNAAYAPLASRPWATILKAADETRTSTTTLAADASLVVALPAGTWTVRAGIFGNTANATMGFKFDFDFTGTGTLTAWRLARCVPGVAGGTDSETVKTGSGSLGGPFNMTAATFGVARVEIEIIVTVTVAGNFRFLWAQGTSDPAACSVLAGSWIDYAKAA